jgi:hypothetical protein
MDADKDLGAEDAQAIVDALCKFPMFSCRPFAQTFGKILIPCAEVACDDKAVLYSLGQYVGEFFLSIPLVGECVVEAQGLFVLAVCHEDACLCEVRQKCPPAALDGKRQMSVSCELQEDGEAALYVEAGVGVFQDAGVPCLDDVFDGGIGGFLLVALRCGGLEEGHRVRGVGDEVDVRHGTSRPFRRWYRQQGGRMRRGGIVAYLQIFVVHLVRNATMKRLHIAVAVEGRPPKKVHTSLCAPFFADL